MKEIKVNHIKYKKHILYSGYNDSKWKIKNINNQRNEYHLVDVDTGEVLDIENIKYLKPLKTK